MFGTIGDFVVEVIEGAPSAIAEWHEREEAAVALVLRGSAMECGAAIIPGSVTYCPTEAAARVAFGDTGGTLLRIGIGPDGLSQFGVTGRHCATIADYATIGERIRRELQSRDAGAKLALRSAVLHLLGRAIRLFRDSGAKPPWLLAARDMIAARSREALRPADVAAAVGVPEARLSKAFRAQLGMTVTGAIRLTRVEVAARELRRSADSVVAVAARCGFCDASHLIRAFEALHGVTPAVFRGGDRP